MTPKTLLTQFPETLLTIDSTLDARRKDTKDQLLINDPTFDPSTVAMRFEVDRGLLFVDAAWMLTLTDENNLPLQETLQNNIQYRGKATIRMLRGTGHLAPAIDAHVFDLNLANAQRAIGLPTTQRIIVRNRLLKEHQHNMAAVAKAMEVVDTLDPLIIDKTVDKESMRHMLGEARRMLAEAKRLAAGLQPLKRVKKPRVHVHALDAYIMECKQKRAIDVKQTRLLVEAGVPYLTTTDKAPTIEEADLLGLYKEHVNLDGTNHRRRLHLRISELKKHVPNYRHDYRYTTSHATYIRYIDADGTPRNTTLYCAVFDMLRSASKADA